MALKRPCLDCGAPTEGSRCVRCRRPVEAERQARQPYRAGYRDPRYRQARRLALQRDGFRCVVCGDTATEVDHIVPLSRGGDPVDTTNLRSVCERHNPRGGRISGR